MPVDFAQKEKYHLEDLLEIVRILRSNEGCPWDREQDHHSLRKGFLEEAYEVCEAIDTENRTLLCEELGDVLLQVAFHAQLEAEQKSFDFDDVCDGICKKLIYRHPHIFADTQAGTAEEVLRNWDALKKKEKKQTTDTQALEDVPKALPALMRSAKVQHRAARAGFDYPNADWAMRDLCSEVQELKQAMAEGDSAHCCEELGDLLFSAVNLSRFLCCDAEESLTASCEKFIARFAVVERLANERGIDMKRAPLEDLDRLWKQAKLVNNR